MDPRLLDSSLWKSRYKKLWCFLCPLCKAARRVSFQPKPGLWHFVQIFFTSVFVSLLTWPWLSWKGLVSFIPLWTLFEVAYRWRMRLGLRCSQCGFDPYLFMIDHNWAKKEVESHWRKKFAEKGVPYPEKNLPPKPREIGLDSRV